MTKSYRLLSSSANDTKDSSLLQGMDVAIGGSQPLVTLTPTRMGIGCSDPEAVLHVGGDVTVDGTLRVAGSGSGLRLSLNPSTTPKSNTSDALNTSDATEEKTRRDEEMGPSTKQMVAEIQARVDECAASIYRRMDELFDKRIREIQETTKKPIENVDNPPPPPNEKPLTLAVADARYVTHEALRSQNFITTQRAAASFERKK